MLNSWVIGSSTGTGEGTAGTGTGTTCSSQWQWLSVAMMRSMSGSNEWDRRPTGITNTFYPVEWDDENYEQMNE